MDAWTEVQGFSSLEDFHSLQQQITAALTKGSITQTPVAERYANVGFREEWYRMPQGETWRLVHPDFPFKGVFERVSRTPELTPARDA